MRALIYTAMGENALADENYRHALRLAPRNPDLANNYGLFLCDAGGKPDEAMKYFESALASRAYASPAKALTTPATGSLKLKQIDAAERYLLEALRYDPSCRPSRPAWRGFISNGATVTRAEIFHQPPDGGSETRVAAGRRAVAGHPGQAHGG